MKIAKDGYPFILANLVAGGLLWWGADRYQSPVLGILSGICVLAGLFCTYFFRDPKRVIPEGDHWILSPADGRITEIVQEADAASGQTVSVVRIFLSVFDPHIQRAPVAGTVKAIAYRTGCFLDARDPKACIENEQNRLDLQPTGRLSGTSIGVTQIAGLIARRIVCWVKEGQSLEAGEKFGLIRFGSQVNLFIPTNAQLKVKAGDRVEAGATIIAEVNG